MSIPSLLRFAQETFSNPRSRRRRTATEPRAATESLESRQLLSATAALDFDGGTVSQQQMVAAAWLSAGNVTYDGFEELFNGQYQWLDFDNDGASNAADAAIAKERILEKVRQDFSPYDLPIRDDQNNFGLSKLENRVRGDVIVMITANQPTDFNFRFLLSPGLTVDQLGGLGVAPHIDRGNEADDIVWVWGETIVGESQDDPEQFVNEMAQVISHEMGHAFGLAHVDSSDPNNIGQRVELSHSMMDGRAINRDDDHDFGFQDITYVSEFDPANGINRISQNHPELNVPQQNAHRHLTTVFGPSNGAWAATLKPGVLTVQASAVGLHASIRVTPISGDSWNIDFSEYIRTPEGYLIDARAVRLDTQNPIDHNSINPFEVPLQSVLFFGSSQRDVVRFDPTFDVGIRAWGGAGNDYIETGAGRDVVYGNAGADVIVTNGDNDVLIGGDFLGSVDFATDTLVGGAGSDLFSRPIRRTSTGGWIDEDRILDFQSTEDRIYIRFVLI